MKLTPADAPAIIGWAQGSTRRSASLAVGRYDNSISAWLYDGDAEAGSALLQFAHPDRAGALTVEDVECFMDVVVADAHAAKLARARKLVADADADAFVVVHHTAKSAEGERENGH